MGFFRQYWNGLSFPSTNMFASIYSWVADKSDLKANGHSWQNHFSYWVIGKHIQWLYYCELYTDLHFQYFPCLFMNICVFLCILKDHFSQFFKSWKLLCIVNISILMSWYFKNIDSSHPKSLLIFPIFNKIHQNFSLFHKDSINFFVKYIHKFQNCPHCA